MKNLFAQHLKNFRFERKFYLERFRARDVESLLKLHPAIFREIYHKRQVNNIYFDSHNLASYADNINGVSQRVKYRIRWYGELFGFIRSPVLEIKLKNNHHVGKISYPLKPLQVGDELSKDAIYKVIRKSAVPLNIKFHLLNLDIKLLNTYRRKYFLSSSGLFRVTVDWGMQAYRLLSHQNRFAYQCKNINSTIVELKYNKNSDDLAEAMMQALPFRITKNSKYVEGLNRLYASF